MADHFSRRHTTRELAQLKRWVGIDLFWPALIGILALYVLFVASLTVVPSKPTSKSFSAIERSLIKSRSSDLEEFVLTQQDYRSWLEQHGTRGEVRVFNGISEMLFNAAAWKKHNELGA